MKSYVQNPNFLLLRISVSNFIRQIVALLVKVIHPHKHYAFPVLFQSMETHSYIGTLLTHSNVQPYHRPQMAALQILRPQHQFVECWIAGQELHVKNSLPPATLRGAQRKFFFATAHTVFSVELTVALRPIQRLRSRFQGSGSCAVWTLASLLSHAWRRSHHVFCGGPNCSNALRNNGAAQSTPLTPRCLNPHCSFASNIFGQHRGGPV